MPAADPQARSLPVHEWSPLDRMTSRRLQLVAEADFQPFVFGWTNQSGVLHYSSNLLTLVDLLGRVGHTKEWAWVTTWSVDDPAAIAQACGRVDRGFVVEVGLRWKTSQIVRLGAARFPRVNVAMREWPCWSSLDELHGLGRRQRSWATGWSTVRSDGHLSVARPTRTRHDDPMSLPSGHGADVADKHVW